MPQVHEDFQTVAVAAAAAGDGTDPLEQGCLLSTAVSAGSFRPIAAERRKKAAAVVTTATKVFISAITANVVMMPAGGCW